MSRSTYTSGNSRVLLRTAVAALSTLSFLALGASPTAHAATGTDRARPSGADVPHRVQAVVAYLQGPLPRPLAQGLVTTAS
ncbi:hypothetical protein ACIOMQ_03295 [Streptomyces sp. NPDC087845]|uniref:hypothetical protein n=1 Tax=Streptomyces sp. NPDC087845 TaxID=3365806 RepID=UPI00380A8629